MRKFFKVVSILNIFAVVLFMTVFIIFSTSITDPTLLGIIERSEYLVYIAGAVILLGSAGNVSFALNTNLWRKAEELEDERIQYHEMTRKLRIKKIQLADAITAEKKKDGQYAEGYDDGYNRRSLEEADKNGYMVY